MGHRNELPEYDHVKDELEDCQLNISAPAYHGALCGYFCTTQGADMATWRSQMIQQILDIEEASPEVADDISSILVDPNSALSRLFLASDNQLNDAEYGFRLLLPDDSVDLKWRLDGLANWCDGFIIGLTANGLHDFDLLPKEMSELLKDLIEISRVDRDPAVIDEEDTESEEKSFVAVMEYVRTGVLVFWAELRNQSSTQDDKPVLH